MDGFQFLVILNIATLNTDVQIFCMNIKIFIVLRKTIFLDYYLSCVVPEVSFPLNVIRYYVDRDLSECLEPKREEKEKLSLSFFFFF